jgi:hypothetical protein
MLNKKLEALLEKAVQAKLIKESELGSVAAEPVHGSEEAKEHTPEMENSDVYPAEEHQQAEEVKEIVIESELGSVAAEPVHDEKAPEVHTPEVSNKDILVGQHAEEVKEVVVESEVKDKAEPEVKAEEKVEKISVNKVDPEFIKKFQKKNPNWNGDWFTKKQLESDVEPEKEPEEFMESYTQEDLLELFEALNLDTDKYTFEYLAEELGFVPEEEMMPQAEVQPEMELAQDPGEYDEEGSMAKSQLIIVADAAAELYNMMDDNANLPEWVQSKLTLAKEYIDTVRDYLKSEMIKQSEEMPAVEVQPEAQEEALQERYVLKRPVGRPSEKSKMLDAKGASEVDSKGQVVYTNKKNGGK